MAATIEVKYYNSFWLKKIASITAVVPGRQIAETVTQNGDTITITSSLPDTEMNVGQSVTILLSNSGTYTGFITERISSTEFKVSPTPSPVLSGNVTIIFIGTLLVSIVFLWNPL